MQLQAPWIDRASHTEKCSQVLHEIDHEVTSILMISLSFSYPADAMQGTVVVDAPLTILVIVWTPLELL
jgi:hypothetical protein